MHDELEALAEARAAAKLAKTHRVVAMKAAGVWSGFGSAEVAALLGVPHGDACAYHLTRSLYNLIEADTAMLHALAVSARAGRGEAPPEWDGWRADEPPTFTPAGGNPEAAPEQARLF